ncbi:MAG: hypothetical protein BWK80_15310, partial [Desulfobacteraceae bacterium IS3]
AKRKPYIPVVLSRQEIDSDTYRFLFDLCLIDAKKATFFLPRMNTTILLKSVSRMETNYKKFVFYSWL